MVVLPSRIRGFVLNEKTLRYISDLKELLGPRRRLDLQRLFSAFPGGLRGIGLLLVRTMVGVWMILQAATYVKGVAEPNLSHYALGALVAASGVLLLFGFLTPIASVMATAWSLKVSWLTLTTIGIYDAGSFLRPGIVAVAIALLGPGAFSIDCRLFGRRQIIIPPGEWSTRQRDLQ